MRKILLLFLMFSVESHIFSGGCLSSCLKKTDQEINVELTIAHRVKKNRSHKTHATVIDDTYRTQDNALLITTTDYNADGTPVTKMYCPIIPHEETQKLMNQSDIPYESMIYFRYGCY